MLLAVIVCLRGKSSLEGTESGNALVSCEARFQNGTIKVARNSSQHFRSRDFDGLLLIILIIIYKLMLLTQ